MTFKVKTKDTLLLMNRTITVEATSEEELIKRFKVDFPNTTVLGVEVVIDKLDAK